MNPVIKNILKFLLFLGIGIALIYLSARGITSDEWKNIKDAFNPANCNYFWVALSLLVGIFSHFLRAVRWRMLIEPIAKKPRFANAFLATIIGYMANYAIPRLGEVSRPGILAKYEKISFTELLGTIVLERVIDTLLLIVLFILTIAIETGNAMEMIKTSDFMGNLNHWLQSHIIIWVGLLILIIIGIIIIFRSKNKLLKIVKKYVESFWLGIKSVGKVKKPVLFWFYSVAIWMAYLFATYLCFFCFGGTSQLSLGDGLVLLIVGSVAVIITPGGTGAYQLLIANVLVAVYHIQTSLSVALPWLIWGSQLILIVSLGLISLLLLPIINKNDKTGIHQN